MHPTRFQLRHLDLTMARLLVLFAFAAVFGFLPVPTAAVQNFVRISEPGIAAIM